MRGLQLRKWVGVSCLLAMAVLLAAWTSPQTGAQRPEQSAGMAPEFRSVNVVRVKPELVTEWMEFQTKETIPALQKGGIRQRDAWQTVVGEGFEYAFVSPMASLGVRDESGPIVKALGEEGARTYGTKYRRFIESSRSYIIRTRPDLSYVSETNAPPALAVLSAISIAPGRVDDYANHLKTEILPIHKQGKSKGFFVSQTIFGGDGNEFVTLSLVDSFADLDKGPVTMRVLGPEGAAKLAAKSAGLVAHVERVIIRHNPRLSFGTSGTSPTSSSK